MSPTLTIPGELLIAPFKMLRRGVNGRIILSRVFQKRLGECAMSRFIAWSGHSASVSDTADNLWDWIIKSYIYLVGLPFILSWAGDQIYRTDILRAYFEQWQVVKDFLALREAQKWKQVETGDWTKYRDLVLSKTGYSEPLFSLFNPRQPLLNVERYKCSRLLDIQDDQKLTDDELCKLPTEMLQETSDPSVFFTLQKEAVPLASVFIGMDVIIIFSNVLLRETYREAITIQYDAIHIPAWLKYQSTRVTDPFGYFNKIYFDDYGKINFEIPQRYETPHIATLDTYALKYYLNLTKLPTKLLFLEPWTGAPVPPPEFVLYYKEPWSTYVAYPPEFTQRYLEEWTGVPPYPPAFVQRVLEEWSS